MIDVGGGDSRLVDALIELGLRCVTVLDVSHEALVRAATRLGTDGNVVSWLEADVTTDWPVHSVDFWHDRAVFHFLVAAEDRLNYINRLRSSVKRRGSVVIATFALDGPPTCSGLPVMRYAPQTLAAELGDEFVLLDGRPAQHVTPWGRAQSFQYSRFKRV